MDILGTGVDLVFIPRIRKMIERWGPDGLTRVFHPLEVEYAFRSRYPCGRLAGRFAAREALVKALGEFPPGGRWRDIQVTGGQGAPVLIAGGAWQERFRQLGVDKIHLSLSHSGDYAVAQVIIQGRNRGGGSAGRNF